MNIKEIMKNHSYIIWDLDGTILDSMPYWETLGRDYLLSLGITPPDDLEKIVEAMTMEESATYFRKELGVDKDNSTIIAEIMSFIEEEYRYVIPAKAWAKDIIPVAAAEGCRMCVLTTSDGEMAGAALKRNDLAPYIERVLTASELGMDKRSGGIYEKTCQIMGYDIRKTLICEDALYAIQGASETDADVLAVPDPSNENQWSEIERIADYYVE